MFYIYIYILIFFSLFLFWEGFLLNIMEICFLYSLERGFSGKLFLNQARSTVWVLWSLFVLAQKEIIFFIIPNFVRHLRGTHIAFSLYLCSFRTGIINFNYSLIANKISVQYHYFGRVKICWFFSLGYFPCLPENQGSSKTVNSFLTCSKVLVLPKR